MFSEITYQQDPNPLPSAVWEQEIEAAFLDKLRGLKYWKACRVAELALMADLVPLLNKRAADREISGLSAYEQ